MLKWLFRNKEEIKKTKFSELSIGQRFKKTGEDKTCIKTRNNEYETLIESFHSIKWFRVTKDFDIQDE